MVWQFGQVFLMFEVCGSDANKGVGKSSYFVEKFGENQRRDNVNIIYPKATNEEMNVKAKKVELAKPKDYSVQKNFFCTVMIILLNLTDITLIISAVMLQGPLKILFLILGIFLLFAAGVSNWSVLANAFKKEPNQTVMESVYDKLFPYKKQEDIAYKKLVFDVQRCRNLVKSLTYLQEQQCEVKQLSPDTLMINYKDGPDTINISPDICKCEGETLDFSVIDNLIRKWKIR